MWHAYFNRHPDDRVLLGSAGNFAEIRAVAAHVRAVLNAAEAAGDAGALETHTPVSGARTALPYWFSQPKPRNLERDVCGRGGVLPPPHILF